MLAMERVEENARRLGLSRRQFLMTACGIATTLLGRNKETAAAAPSTEPHPTGVQRSYRDATAGPGIQCQTGVQWRNWSENVSSTPECAFHPETGDDLIHIVNQARAACRVDPIARLDLITPSDQSWPGRAVGRNCPTVKKALEAGESLARVIKKSELSKGEVTR